MESNNLQIHSSVLPKYSDVPLEIVRPLLYVRVLCKVKIFSDTFIYVMINLNKKILKVEKSKKGIFN